eukprot:3647479-Pyramimonas_sp.AAC.1
MKCVTLLGGSGDGRLEICAESDNMCARAELVNMVKDELRHGDILSRGLWQGAGTAGTGQRGYAQGQRKYCGPRRSVQDSGPFC